MPYVSKELRELVRLPITDLRDGLDGYTDRLRAAVLVEIVTTAMEPATGWRYHHLHRAYGVFLAAAAEADRRLPGGLARFQGPIEQIAHWLHDEYVNIAFFQGSIEQIAHSVRMQPDENRDGYLNYIVSMIAPNGSMLQGAGRVFYDEVVAPYEDLAIAKNGDIEVYS